MQMLSEQTSPKTIFMYAGRLVVFISLYISVSTGVLAAQQIHDWQKQRLLHPTTAQRADEQRGHVFIYDGLSDQEINQAMDKNFDRIETMMFINVKKPKAVTEDSPSEGDKDELDNDDDGC